MQNKPPIRPPSTPPSFSRDPRQSRYRLIAYLGLGALIAAVVGVVVLLPALVERAPSDVRAAERPAERAPGTGNRAASEPEPENIARRMRVARQAVDTAAVAANETARAAQKSAVAERQLEIALRRQARLENAGVKIWGVERLVTSYAEATRKLVDGDGYFRNGEFDRAAAAYRQAGSRFEQLATSRPERLGRALNNGSAALDRLDDVVAADQFAIALAVEPGNPVAQIGLKRARNLPRVIERFEQARRLEAAGELDRARRAYREVEALDGDFQPSRDARARVERRIVERDYRRAVSDALSALERRDYSRSKDALATVRRLRPGAPEAREIALRLRAAIQRDRLDSLRRRAGELERGEDWAASLRVYGTALGIDADAGFAVRGKSRSERFLALNRQLDRYLAEPDRLHSPEPLAHANEVLAAVARVENAGPKLAAKRQRLGALIAAANEPQDVILRSDEKTNVVVYRVARFGRFTERRLKLRPGNYTAVGSCPGYRDVRVRFRVLPSSAAIVVEVRCEERI